MLNKENIMTITRTDLYNSYLDHNKDHTAIEKNLYQPWRDTTHEMDELINDLCEWVNHGCLPPKNNKEIQTKVGKYLDFGAKMNPTKDLIFSDYRTSIHGPYKKQHTREYYEVSSGLIKAWVEAMYELNRSKVTSTNSNLRSTFNDIFEADAE